MSNVSEILNQRLRGLGLFVKIQGEPGWFMCTIHERVDEKSVKAKGIGSDLEMAVERCLINWEENRKPDPRQDSLFKESESAPVSR